MIKALSHNTLEIPHNSLVCRYFFLYSLIFAIVLSILWSTASQAQSPHIEISALFENKAMLIVDGERVLVSVGDVTKHGIKLISADADKAVIEYQGQRSSYVLGNIIRQSDVEKTNTDTADIIVYQGTDTMFRTIGSINGYPVNFLVDTGASVIAISSAEAKRLGINYRLDGEPTWVSTASGVERATAVTIDRVTISGITIRSVEGLVIDGNEPSVPLLGMSYLKRFTIINDGNMMRLKRKY